METIENGYAKVVGYNDIVIGDRVYYGGKIYYVTKVSKLGYMSLREEDKKSNNIIAYPKDLKKVSLYDE